MRIASQSRRLEVHDRPDKLGDRGHALELRSGLEYLDGLDGESHMICRCDIRVGVRSIC